MLLRRILTTGTVLLIAGCGEPPVGIEEVPPDPQLSFSRAAKVWASPNPDGDVEGRYLVMVRRGAPDNLAGAVAPHGGQVEFSHPMGFAIVSGLSDTAARRLSLESFVTDLQPDEIFKLDPLERGGTPEAVGAGMASASDPTGAFFYARQWNMRAIDADVAWAAGSLGSPGVTVAILDSGIDYTYPDLAGRVDLSRSISFVPFDDALADFYFPGKHPVTDLHFHGTHVASTVVSNGDVIAGVTSQTTLIGIKVCSVVGECAFSGTMAGILHAADNGAEVANMSLGVGFLKAGQGRFVGIINQIFNYANRRGVTLVVAAGNEGFDLNRLPAVYTTYCDAPNAICVSATGPISGGPTGTTGPFTDPDTPAPYSNWGVSAISMAAPGGTREYFVEGGASVWAACSQTSLVFPICGTATFVLGMNGTSMAAAHVSGVGALIVAKYGGKPAQVRFRLVRGADDLGKRGADAFYGKGRVNAAGAIGLN